MGDLERALGAFERALIINSQSWAALTMAAHVCRCKEDYGRVSPVSHSSCLFLRSLFAFPRTPVPPEPPGHLSLCLPISPSHFAKERTRTRPPLPACLLLCAALAWG